MPASRAARTQANAASSSTWPPWVSQLPYAISEMFRPERPRRLNSTSPNASRGVSQLVAGCHSSDRGAQRDLGLREAPATDHRGAADAVPDEAPGALGLRIVREALGDLPLFPSAEDHRVDDHDQEEAQQHDGRVVLDGEARGDGADQRDRGDDEEEAADVAPGVHDVAHELADRPAVARGQVVV